MKVGDLVYLKPKSTKHADEDFIGLVIHKEQVGSGKTGSTILYDVMLTETNELITISDVYFKIWRVE
jgi:hypothetical protein|tara:strand:+ start:181 stop:381 length:201 start_codon:yes stop_codon:yes gene_type:complete